MIKYVNLRGPYFSGKTTALRRLTLEGAGVQFVRAQKLDRPFPLTFCPNGVVLVGKYAFVRDWKEVTADALNSDLASVLVAARRFPETRVIVFEGDLWSTRSPAIVQMWGVDPTEVLWAYLDTPLAVLRDRMTGFKFANSEITNEQLQDNMEAVRRTQARVKLEGWPTADIPHCEADETLRNLLEKL